MTDALARRALRQAGVLARPQVLAAGRSDAWLAWRLRRGDWRTLHPGTYVTHTGPVGWRTRAWAGVLYAGPGAALGGRSAAYDLGIVRRRPDLVDVVVPAHRRVRGQPGLRVRRRAGLDTCTVQASPPRTRVDETVLDLLAGLPDEDAVVALLCDGLRAGAHPRTLQDLLARSRGSWRGLALEAVEECEAGVESALEHRFRRDVLRRHALPPFTLQVRQRLDGWWVRSDARCAPWRTRVELDGRLAHPGGATDDDTWRDNEVGITTGDRTLRYRWRHVAGHPCLTAAQVGAALTANGWPGSVGRCGAACAASRARSGALRGRS